MNKQEAIALIGAIVPEAEAKQIVDALIKAKVLQLESYGDADVNSIVDGFKQLFGNTKTTRYDRYAAHRLAEQKGVTAVVGIIKLLHERSEEQFCPSVASVSELETKWVKVVGFLRRQSDEHVEIQ